MHIVMKCPCGAKLKAPDKLVGREINCPKCKTKLVVPQPPTAVPAAPVVPVAELIDTVSPDPLMQQGYQTGHMQQPVYGQPQQRPLPKAKPKKNVSWIRLAAVATVLFLIAGGVLFWAFRSAQTVESNSGTAVFVDGKKVNMGSGKKKLDPKFTNFEDQEPRKRIPNSEKNTHDSGNKKIDIASRVGSGTALELDKLTEKVDPSIVRIKVKSQDGGEKIGSGFFIDTEGKIVTNYHVVQGASSVTVETLNKKDIEVLGHCGADAEKDLAIIQIDPSAVSGVPISLPSTDPRKGEKVAAFGSPQGFGFTATLGNISSMRSGNEISGILKEMTSVDVYNRLGYTTDMNWIQTTTPISGGNSGGPLVNMKGELIGVNTWTHPGGQNLNFASSVDEVIKLYEKRDGELHRIQMLYPRVDVYRDRGGESEDDGLGF